MAKDLNDTIDRLRDSTEKSSSIMEKMSSSLGQFARNNLGAKSGALVGGGLGLLVGRNAVTGAIGAAVGSSIGALTDLYFNRKDAKTEKNEVVEKKEKTTKESPEEKSSNRTNELLTRTNQLLEAALSKAGLGRLAAIEQRLQDDLDNQKRQQEKAEAAAEEARRESKSAGAGHEMTHSWLSKIANILGLQLVAQKSQALFSALSLGFGAMKTAIGAGLTVLGGMISTALTALGLKKVADAIATKPSPIGSQATSTKSQPAAGVPGQNVPVPEATQKKPGILSKTGKVLKTLGKASVVGAATLGAGMLLDQVPEGTTGKETGSAALNIAGYAGTGAMIGSVIPVIGTGVGALVGAAVGAAMTDWTAVLEDGKKVLAKGSDWAEKTGKPLMNGLVVKAEETKDWISEKFTLMLDTSTKWFDETLKPFLDAKWQNIISNLSTIISKTTESAGKFGAEVSDWAKVSLLGMNPKIIAAEREQKNATSVETAVRPPSSAQIVNNAQSKVENSKNTSNVSMPTVVNAPVNKTIATSNNTTIVQDSMNISNGTLAFGW